MHGLLNAVLSAAGVLGIMGLIFGILLAFASKFFYVHEDERKEKILECLPGANCGGCGFAGCAAFTDALLLGDAAINMCNVVGQQTADAIAQILGVETAAVEKKYARICCAGSSELAHTKYQYQGIADCVAAARLLEGHMQCRFGCLGFGSCAAVCKNGAIKIFDGVASVDVTLCGGCGECIDACPKHIIELVPEKAKFFVACSSQEKGIKTKKACLTGCIGCKLCEKNCPVGAITVTNNLAHIDYNKCTSCGICVEKCPVGIVRSIS